ncbi:hypothetical protein PsorP6_009175 [Peronosclerospora sorghi]|uniref:Uncharacterized protein n=1 Tax=Peronosclerospora sorghi TaxID=230839 RepID=A0ACC0W065_9STRA|nr:hypothetical protein PsorP6_009175 [Peronosclerospora sorghi]
MYLRDDLRKDSIVQNIINVMYLILKRETQLDIPLVTYRTRCVHCYHVLLGVGDRHADNVILTKDGILFHIDYGFILGKDPKPLQPPMRLDHYMIEALVGTQTQQFEQFRNCS